MVIQIYINLNVKWSGGEVITTPLPIPPIDIPETVEGFDTFESFGANSFYKEFIDNISIEGNKVKSINPIFNDQYLGKSFCGIMSHENPQEENFDYYYPSMIASRYAKVVKVISQNELELDFTFNRNSKKGYFFFDNTEAFIKALNSDSEKILLKENATYVVPEYETITRNKDLIIKGVNSTLLIGYESYFQWAKEKKIKQPNLLFYSEAPQINIILDCNIHAPYTSIGEVLSFNRDLFRNNPNNAQKAVYALINSKHTEYSKFNTAWKGWCFGITYSGLDVYNYCKNVENHSIAFLQPKSNNKDGSISMVLENCKIYETPQELNQDQILVEGFIDSENCFNITSNHTLYQIYNQFMFPSQWGNAIQILHIDRFVFPIRTRNIINSKKFKIDLYKNGEVIQNVHYINGGLRGEFNPSDILEIDGTQYTVIQKDRSEHPYFSENNYVSMCYLDKKLTEGSYYTVKVITSSALPILNKRQGAYLIYKSNAEWPHKANVEFGKSEIIMFTPNAKALFYTHRQVNIWSKYVEIKGYYRQSFGQGNQKYCNLVNVKNVSPRNVNPYFGNEFSAQVPITTDMKIPSVIEDIKSKI